MLKSFLRVLFLIVFGIALAIFTLEGLLRLNGAKPQTYLRQFSQYHSILGWEKKPYAEGHFRKGDVLIHEKINSRGLRDKEYSYEKSNDIYRILVLGDSFTEGYDVDIENLFTEILENRLNRELTPLTRKSYEVINAGTGGYSNDQEYLFYLTEGYKYHPDEIVLMIYPTNDIYYNNKGVYGNYKKPLFEIESDTLKLSNAPLPPPGNQESFKNIFRDMALYPVVTGIILTKLPSLTNVLAKIGLVSESTLSATTANVTSSSNPSSVSSFSVYEKRSHSFMDDAWRKTYLILKTLKEKATANGAKLSIFYVPDRIEVYDSDWESTKRQYALSDSLWSPMTPQNKLDSISNKAGIDFINFASVLQTTYFSDSIMYNGVHWNIAGNRIVANYLYSHFAERQLNTLK